MAGRVGDYPAVTASEPSAGGCPPVRLQLLGAAGDGRLRVSGQALLIASRRGSHPVSARRPTPGAARPRTQALVRIPEPFNGFGHPVCGHLEQRLEPGPALGIAVPRWRDAVPCSLHFTLVDLPSITTAQGPPSTETSNYDVWTVGETSTIVIRALPTLPYFGSGVGPSLVNVQVFSVTLPVSWLIMPVLSMTWAR